MKSHSSALLANFNTQLVDIVTIADEVMRATDATHRSQPLEDHRVRKPEELQIWSSGRAAVLAQRAD